MKITYLPRGYKEGKERKKGEEEEEPEVRYLPTYLINQLN